VSGDRPGSRAYLNVYGSRYSVGLQGDGATPATAESLILMASSLGLAGLEMPVDCARGLDEPSRSRVRSLADSRGIALVLSSLGTDPEQLRGEISLASSLGARVLVTALKETRFGGDRRHLAGQWPALMTLLRQRMSEVIRDAERAHVAIGIENHQDLDSADLLALCSAFESEAVGVTFDGANALGVAELPTVFLEAVEPYVVHAHLKDYLAQWRDDGYALIRCPVGDGIVPLGAIVRRLSQTRPNVQFSIEVGALIERVVRVCADDFWTEHRARPLPDLARLLAFVGSHAVSSGTDLRTPFECGENAATICAFEHAQLARSVAYAAAQLPHRQ
jgi:3-oxoisoapionate decarboxylase